MGNPRKDIKMTLLLWLELWYLKECNDDWEHKYGINIFTLANPGWAVDICLKETYLEDENFPLIETERSKDDWVHCKVENNIFKGRGGPENLEEMLLIFKRWAESF